MNPTVEYLSRLLAYDRWANHEALESILGTKLHRSRKLLGHIVSAEWMWMSRLSQVGYSGVTWPEWTFEECDEQLQAVESAWVDCLAGVSQDGAIRRVSYAVKDTTYDVSAADIVTHVVMHSSYHRGQIAVDQRLAGQGPPFTDYMECIQKGMLG
jgi:uncharacterized damage-inducible protein DinB